MTNIPVEERINWIGASEVPALFGQSPWCTRYELWHRKKGNLPDEIADNEPMFWGRKLEPAIAAGLAEREGAKIRKVRRYIPHPTVDRLGASLDYEYVAHPDGPGVLQIKNVDRAAFAHHWTDEEPPLYYLLQVQTELACAGRSWGKLAALVGGNKLHVYRIEAHDGAQERIAREVKRFWQSIDDDDPPEPNFREDSKSIAALYMSVSPGTTANLDDPELIEAAADYLFLGQEIKRISRARDAKRAKLIESMRDAERAIVGPYAISTAEIGGADISYTRRPYRRFIISGGDNQETE